LILVGFHGFVAVSRITNHLSLAFVYST